MGGLKSYGVSIVDLYRRAPAMWIRFFEAPPVINLRTATQLGLTLPQSQWCFGRMKSSNDFASTLHRDDVLWPHPGHQVREAAIYVGDPQRREARKPARRGRDLGLTVPSSLLLWADPVTE
jgi:hypothetical protein